MTKTMTVDCREVVQSPGTVSTKLEHTRTKQNSTVRRLGPPRGQGLYQGQLDQSHLVQGLLVQGHLVQGLLVQAL